MIECLDFREFLCRYDRPHSLFYLDPPYWGSEGDYGRDLFQREDFEALAETLGGLKGRFILSLNDHSEVHRLFGRFEFEEVETTYTVNSGDSRRAGELIITGPP